MLTCKFTPYRYPKNGLTLNECEDYYDYKDNVFCLCDGASESYNSKMWAKILANKFIENQNINDEWITNAIETYEKGIDVNKLSWSQQASFLRGSFSTLLGLIADLDNKLVTIKSIGDSIAFCLYKTYIGYDLKGQFPYNSPEQFKDKPSLLSTKSNLNINIKTKNIQFGISNDTIILLMSDAIAEWTLRYCCNNDNNIDCILAALENENKIYSFIEAIRREKTLRNDDITILQIKFLE